MGRLLGRGQDRVDAFRLAPDVQDDRARLDPADGAGDDLALHGRVAPEGLLALDLAEALHEDLARGLGVGAQQFVGVDLLELDGLAELGVGLEAACLLERELRLRILDLFDRHLGAVDADGAGLRVHLDGDVLVAGRGAPVGRLDGLLDGAHEGVLGDALLSVQLQEGADEFTAHVAPPSRSNRAVQQRTWGSPTSMEAAGLLTAREYSTARRPTRAWRRGVRAGATPTRRGRVGGRPTH